MKATLELPEEITSVCKVRRDELGSFFRKIIAIELYREGLVSLGKAADIAGLDRIAMMDLLRERKVPIQYGTDDLEKDIKTLEMVLE